VRPALFIASVIGSLGLTVAADPSWHLVRSPGTGCWPPKCQAGQVPLATPVVSHGGRLIMIGDGAAPRQVYESDDGSTWRAHSHDARWGARYKAADASYAGALWRVAGFVQHGDLRTLMNDVWRSADGRHWERLVERAPWPPRSDARLVASRGMLYLIGGEPNDGTIWETTNGRLWRPRRVGTLPREMPQGVLVYRDALWILGHGPWESARNDIWTSSDGFAWTQVTAKADRSPRTDPGYAVLNDRLWIVGGADHRDVWSSSDGRHWERASAELPGPPRTTEFSVVFRDGFWVFGGKTGGKGGTGFWDGVWFLK
jgi:hypothetical protein